MAAACYNRGMGCLHVILLLLLAITVACATPPQTPIEEKLVVAQDACLRGYAGLVIFSIESRNLCKEAHDIKRRCRQMLAPKKARLCDEVFSLAYKTCVLHNSIQDRIEIVYAMGGCGVKKRRTRSD